MVEIGVILVCIATVFGTAPVLLCCSILIIALYALVRSNKAVIVGCILSILMLLGSWYGVYRATTLIETPLGNQSINLTISSVDRQLERTVAVARTASGASVQLYTDAVGLLPGDRILATGIIEKPKDFFTDTGRIFGYRSYMESKGITGSMYQAQVRVIEKGDWSISRFATMVRFGIADTFSQHLSFPFDGILSGMLVGYQGGIPESIDTLFRNTGVLHVLVLSGYNITLFAGFLLVVLHRLPYRIRLIATLICIGFLVLVSGAGAASVRAGVMGAIGILAGLTLRTYQPLRALALATLLFFIVSPLTISADPGFHLSFIATFCMIMVVPKVEQFFRFIPSTRYIDIRELSTLAIVMPLFMLPYTMYFSGLAPLAAIPANIVLGIASPLLMIAGALLLGVSWIPPIAHMIGSILGTVLHWIVSFLELVARLPVWNTPSVGGWSVVGIYATVMLCLFRTELIAFGSQLRNSLVRQPSSSGKGSR